MLTGMVVFIVVVLFFVFFVYYKRGMLTQMFALNAAAPADQFRQELEKTADAAIRRLETQIAHLEFLLDEADAKIELLDQKLQALERSPAAQEPPASPPPPSVDLRLAPELPPAADAFAAAQSLSDLLWCSSTLHPEVRQVRAPFK